MAKDKKLGDLVRPIFEKMGAQVEHGSGIVKYTTTMKQLKDFFENDPLGRAIAQISGKGVPLSRLIKEAKKNARI